MNPIISTAGPNASILKEVKALWRKNAKQLGFFPDGAFHDRASNGEILVAANSENELLGYLLYRVSNRQVVTIVHLCVSESARGKGVARNLVTNLKSRVRGLRGISLSCRRDFEANSLWSALGFVVHSERLGRRATGSTLINWWYGFDNDDLFKVLTDPSGDISIVAMDTNVFLDLMTDSNAESSGLKDDWLSNIINLVVTRETRVELVRRNTHTQRKATLTYLRKFEELTGPQDRLEQVAASFEKSVGVPRNEQDRSDLRQLAWAVIGNADFFLTRDEKLLRAHDVVERATGLQICRPAELISEIDKSANSPEYQRDRLAGTLLEVQRVSKLDEDLWSRKFQNVQAAERKTEFLDPIRRALATPESARVFTIQNTNNEIIGLAAHAVTDEQVMKITRARVGASNLDLSLSRYLVNLLLRWSIERGCSVCLVKDAPLQASLEAALSKEGFIRGVDSWLKLSFAGTANTMEVSIRAKQLAQTLDGLLQSEREILARFAEFVLRTGQEPTIARLLSVEHAIWPGLLTDLDLPSFIVPIKPAWALNLFDEGLAARQLFGARPDLALNDEAVYYRSFRNSGKLRAPSRLLWYVSQDRKMLPVGQLRAVSRLDEVVEGTASEIFRRFRRLGIYEWKDVVTTTKGDACGQVMALSFSKTRALAHPVSYPLIQDCLTEHHVRSQLQSPVEIPSGALFDLIRQSTRAARTTNV